MMRWNGEGTEHDLREYDARSADRLLRVAWWTLRALAWLLTAFLVVAAWLVVARAVEWALAALNFA